MIEPSLDRKLHNWQMLLLDLTRANRLLYFKAERGSSVPITAPTSLELFQQLVTQGKRLKFPAANERALFEEDAEEPAATPEPASEAGGATEITVLSGDNSAATNRPSEPRPEVPALSTTKLDSTSQGRNNSTLASSLTEAQLTRALYNLRARARLAAEEQGVNVLFVAFGLLHWIDPETKDEVQSPVVLVPVKLEKERGRDAYSIELLEDDLLLNPTLAYKLAADFDLRLPPLPDDLEETGLAAVLRTAARRARTSDPGWALTDDAILGVFSFQKINLYQDMADINGPVCRASHHRRFGCGRAAAASAASRSWRPNWTTACRPRTRFR